MDFQPSLKYQAVSPGEMSGGVSTARIIGEWIKSYDVTRPHFRLCASTPNKTTWWIG